MNNKRKDSELSKQEKERIEKFNAESERLKKEGYEEHDLTVNVVKANILAFLMALPIMLIIGFIYYLIWKENSVNISRNEVNVPILFIINLLIATIIHESIHGITYSIFTENHFKDVRFGFIWKTLTPYCACLKPLKKHQYILGISMPCIVLGIIPSIISIFINNVVLLGSGFFQIACAGGDLFIIYLILINKSKKNEAIYQDHPTEVGVVLFDK